MKDLDIFRFGSGSDENGPALTLRPTTEYSSKTKWNGDAHNGRQLYMEADDHQVKLSWISHRI